MVPLGLASAGAVMVGRAIGRHDPRGARRAGWMTLGLGATFMTIVGLGLIVIPAWLIGLFTTDTQTIAIGASLLMVASVFQLFDGLQVVGTGVLRGIGDTRTPMIFNLIGHWMIGLPVGWWLCFRAGLGRRGPLDRSVHRPHAGGDRAGGRVGESRSQCYVGTDVSISRCPSTRRRVNRNHGSASKATHAAVP